MSVSEGAERTPRLDLTTEPAVPVSKPVEVTWSQERARESMRGVIAFSLVAMLGVVVAAAFVFMWLHPDKIETLKTLLLTVFTPLVGLVGAATGFYFGGKT